MNATTMYSDFRNLTLSALFGIPGVHAAMENPTAITIISSIVLPFIMFGMGKAADILFQYYLTRRRERLELAERTKARSAPDPSGDA